MKREEFEELLPWYATGTLDAEEARAVEAHLEGSAEARAELATFRALHGVVADTTGEPEWNPGLVNDALARIDALEREKARAAERGGLLAWLRANLVPSWEATPGWARTALAAQLALLLALGGALLLAPREEAGFRTVGGGTVHATAQLSLGFADDATQAEVRALLREIGGQFVGGPSALGLYAVAVDPPLDPEALEALLARLAADPRLRYAEGIR